MVLTLDVEVAPDRTSTKVGLPVARLASATNRPMNPVAPMMRVLLLHWAIFCFNC